jgi:biopolymer transport protein ExbD
MGEIVVKQKGHGPPREEGDEKPRKPTRTGISMDMTPMVDVAFLLLIFFMVTTVFRRPLAMEINMPEPGAKVQVPESNVMTLYVFKDDRILARTGKGPLLPVGWNELETTLREGMAGNDKLIVLVRIAPDARYELMVDMMDVLDDAHMQRFSVVAMTPETTPTGGGAP